MFQKLQQIREAKKLYDQAMQMKKALAQEFITIEKNGVKVVVSADQKIHKIEVEGERQEDTEKALNEAFEQTQKVAAKKLQEMGGGLGGLFGGGQ